MEGRQSWSEIQAQYPEEWVIVTEYEVAGRELSEGKVVVHSKDKDEVDRKSQEITEDCAVVFTGQHRRGLIGLYVSDNVDDDNHS